MTAFDRHGPIAVITVSGEGIALGRRLLAGLRASSRIAGDAAGVALWTPPAYADPHGAGAVAEGAMRSVASDVGARAYDGSLREFIGTLWGDHAAIVGVMASGIMVRAIAPWVRSKLSDPAVVVVDDAGRFAISLLSGHEGGANSLAEAVADVTGGIPVVTTGTEARRRLVVGVGARRGVSETAVLETIDEALAAAGCTRDQIRALATIDLKADEAGVRAAADSLDVPLFVISRERIKALQEALRDPNFVEATTGVAAVCIPAALLTGVETRLIGPRTVREGVTVALARDVCGSSDSAPVDAHI